MAYKSGPTQSCNTQRSSSTNQYSGSSPTFTPQFVVLVLTVFARRMSFTITAHVFQTNPNVFFHVVEQNVWHFANGGTWSEVDGAHVLHIGGSGTAGALRFASEDNDEAFLVVLGVHNSKRWGDIVTDLKNGDTAGVILQQYYEGDHKDRSEAREAQRASFSVSNSKGRKIEFNYTVAEGNNLKVDIIIG